MEYSQRKDPREYLEECGATTEEQEFLVERELRQGWIGRRVEINAMTSDQLISWLEKKLKERGVKKVVPKNDTLISAYHRAKISSRTANPDRRVEGRRRQARRRAEGFTEASGKDPSKTPKDKLGRCSLAMCRRS